VGKEFERKKISKRNKGDAACLSRMKVKKGGDLVALEKNKIFNQRDGKGGCGERCNSRLGGGKHKGKRLRGRVGIRTNQRNSMKGEEEISVGREAPKQGLIGRRA